MRRIWLFIENWILPSPGWLRGLVGRLLVSLIVLFGVWYGFLKLVHRFSVGTTPALIMVWASAFVLLLVFFPNLLDRIKRIKIKDFELELQEAVQQSPNQWITPDDLDGGGLPGQKGDWENLRRLLERTREQSTKGVLLVVNVRDGYNISIPMLFVYLHFLELYAESTAVLFVSQRGMRETFKLEDIRRNKIVGIVDGKNVLTDLLRRFPFLVAAIQEAHVFQEDGFPNENALDLLLDRLRQREFQAQEFLSAGKVRDWFSDELSVGTIDFHVGSFDLSRVQEALAKGEQHLIVLNNGRLTSVIAVCVLAKRISLKTLSSIEPGARRIKEPRE